MKNRPILSTAKEDYDDLAPTFVEYTEKVLFGDVWRRENLSLRDRSLITISALITAEHLNQLPYHLNLAHENGLSNEEIIETITHLAFYVGWPRAASALDTIKKEGEKSPPPQN
ncbi:carboxymuconolactone decarboxylase family protein [Listeria booriae]|uniref:carboxymuconolactone decarboxylase family protein n=1 Tax=Listeria booriae TaxID=1552123 RepID=UPI00162A9F19|nr:carboxymuconolactone decarboxylase family protein [Listeria booriae]MBC2170614.1 carboxymuconolactone decarboxylase family protein [Listeria booriae]